MRGYENLNKDRNDLKMFHSECIKILKIKCFMRGYENLNKDRNDLKNGLFRMHENFKKSNVLSEVTKI